MRRYIYTNLTDKELERLDDAIKRAKFKNRTEFMTACAYATIYPGKTGDWLAKIAKLSENCKQHETAFFKILKELAFPAIAMRGGEAVLASLETDLKKAMYDKCGIVPTKPELRHLIKAFEAVHHAEILAYRTKIHAESFAAENSV